MSFSQKSTLAFSLVSPRGHNLSIKMRVPSVFAGFSYTRLI
jgi:hypothetical protein